MDRMRLTGALMMVGTVLQLIAFLYALTRRSYAALAAPVAVGVAVTSGLGFWVGWTLLAMEDDLSELEFPAEPVDEG